MPNRYIPAEPAAMSHSNAVGVRRPSAMRARTQVSPSQASASGKAFSNSTYAFVVSLSIHERLVNQMVQYATSITIGDDEHDPDRHEKSCGPA